MFIVLAYWNKRPRVDMSLHFDRLFWFWASQSLLFLHTVLVWPDRCSNTQPTALEASTPNRYAIDGVMRPQCFLLFFFYNYDSLNTCFLVFILLFIYLFFCFFVGYHSPLCLYFFTIEFRTAMIMRYFVFILLLKEYLKCKILPSKWYFSWQRIN